MTSLLATTHHGWACLWLVVLLLLALLAFAAFRRGGRGRWAAATPAPDPRAILAERYARGEIGHEEYRERLDHLDERR